MRQSVQKRLCPQSGGARVLHGVGIEIKRGLSKREGGRFECSVGHRFRQLQVLKSALGSQAKFGAQPHRQ